MLIEPNNTIQELKAKFSEKFPGLKIEFYSQKTEEFQGSHKKNELSENISLSELNPDLILQYFDLQSYMSTKKFEKAFEDQLGLNVQVFRKSKDIWLQTSSTDAWTLEEQNTKGINSMNY